MNVTEPEAICASVTRILDLFLRKSRSVNILRPNMHHRLGKLSLLCFSKKGGVSNQLHLTNLFDEFYFVQISFGIPVRAIGPFSEPLVAP